MTKRAVELGMNNSSFGNSTGWPDPLQRMSARDLVKIADLIITEFPNYYPFFAQTSFTWDGVKQNNRNPLLPLGIGADGLKTGPGRPTERHAQRDATSRCDLWHRNR